MANGKIIIDVELNDDGVLKGLDNIEGLAGKGGKSNGGLIGSMFGGMKNIIGAGVALKGVSAAWNALKGGISDGVSRYDTMQRFPKMMEQIGFTAGDANTAVNSLSDGIQGLPTTLDSVTATTQSLALMTGDLGGAVDTTLALNNAFLASGKTSAEASRGMTQFTEMLARGEPDLVGWRTLMDTMPVALRMVSEELGYSGQNFYELYDAMQSGEITFEDFTDALIRLNEEQGGLADMALENSKGIATSWQNVGTAIAEGWRKILAATDRGLARLGLDSIADQIDKLKYAVGSGFTAVASGINWVSRQARKLQPVFYEIGRQITDFLDPLINSVGDFFEPVLTGFGDIGQAVSNFGHGMNEVLRHIGSGRWDMAWQRLKHSGVQAFTEISNALGDMWNGMRERIQDTDWESLGRTLLDGIKSGIEFSRDTLATLGATIKDFILDSLGAENWTDAGRIIMSKVIDGIQNSRDFLAGVGSTVKDFIFEALEAESWTDVGRTIVQGIGDAIAMRRDIMIGAGQAIRDWIFEETGAEDWGGVADVVMSGIGDAWSDAVELLGEVGSAIRDWIFEKVGAETWSDVAEIIFGKIGEKWDDVKSFLGDVGSSILDWISESVEGVEWTGVGESIVEFIGDTFESVSWDSVSEGVGKALGKAIKAGLDVIKGTDINLVDSFNSIADFMWETFKTAITEAFSNFDLNDLLPEVKWGDSQLNWMTLEFEVIPVPEIKDWAGTEAELAQEIQSRLQNMGMNEYTLETIQANLDDFIVFVNQQELMRQIEEKMSYTYDDVSISTIQANIEHVEAYMNGEIDWQQLEQLLREYDAGDIDVNAGSATVKPESAELAEGGIDPITSNEPVAVSAPLEFRPIHSGGVDASGAVAGGGGGMFANLISQMVSEMTEGMRQVNTAVRSGLEEIKLTILLGGQGMGSQMTLAMTEVTTAVTTAFTTIGATVLASMTGITLSVTVGMLATQLAVTTAMTAIETAIQTGWQNAEATTLQVLTSMSQLVGAEYDSMLLNVTNSMTEIESVNTSTWQNIQSEVSNIMGDIVATVSDGMSNIISEMEAAAGPAYTAGSNIALGLADGISASSGAAVSAAQRMADAVNNVLNSVFRFGSPSKVTREYGGWYVDGFILGAESKFNEAKQTMKDLGALFAVPSVNPNYAMGLTGQHGLSSSVTNNQGDVHINFQIGEFNNQRKEDLPELIEELKYYEKLRR